MLTFPFVLPSLQWSVLRDDNFGRRQIARPQTDRKGFCLPVKTSRRTIEAMESPIGRVMPGQYQQQDVRDND